MTIETGTRHVTQANANLFSELGFDDNEARQLLAVSSKETAAMDALKRQMMAELALWIEQANLKQEEAAEILLVSRPRVSDVVNCKTAKFSLDALVGMLLRIGRPITLAVGPCQASITRR